MQILTVIYSTSFHRVFGGFPLERLGQAIMRILLKRRKRREVMLTNQYEPTKICNV
jgi:hypothetical protein